MKVKVGESCFLLYECLGEIVSVDDRMVNEFDLLPPKPKGLVVFDPTRFLPDWKKQGRRTRLQFAKDTYNNVDTALYEKGIARVMLAACVDDGHKVVILFSSLST